MSRSSPSTLGGIGWCQIPTSLVKPLNRDFKVTIFRRGPALWQRLPLLAIELLTEELDTGRAVFSLALDLLDQPQELYRQASPALRKTMNQSIFTKLRLDGTVVTTDELAEPFDVIVPAGRVYQRRGLPTQKTTPSSQWGGLPRGYLGGGSEYV